MSDTAPKKRQALLDQLSRASSEPEMVEAAREADLYLGHYPYDADVAAAAESLERRGARIRDPERGANRWSIGVFVCLAAAVTLALLLYAPVELALAVAAGILVAGEVAREVWSVLEARRNGSG